MRPYVSLHNHTTGSIGDSLITPKELIETTKALGQTSVAATDHGSLSAMWDLYKASTKAGIKLIAGCECYFVENNKSTDEDDNKLYHLVLLAKNGIGYKNLLTINKRGFDNFTMAFKRATSRVDWALLEEFSEGIICTSACGNSMIGQYIMADQYLEAKNTAKRLQDIFKDDFTLELQPHNLQHRPSAWTGPVNQQKINLALKKISQELGIRCIVATDAHYTLPEHHRAHDVYLCDSSGQPITSGNRLRYDKHEFYIKNSDQVYDHFTRHMKVWGEEFVESLFTNTVYYSDKCEMPNWIDPAVSTGEKNQLPDFPYKDEPDYPEFAKWQAEQRKSPGPVWKDNIKEDAQFYRYRSEIGLEQKIQEGKIPEDDRQHCYEAMNEEFDVLELRDYSGYMLISADFLNWGRKNGIPIGPGRGCTTKDTLILTPNGYVPISEIKGGDEVITHTGMIKPVVTSFHNGIANDLVKIKTQWSFGQEIFTSDHLLLAITKKEMEKGKDPDWVPVSKISKGDLLFHPWPERNTQTPDIIDMAQFIDKMGKTYKVCDDYIEIPETTIDNLSIKQIARDAGVWFGAAYNIKNGKKNIHQSKVEKAINAKGKTLEEWQNNKRVRKISRFIHWDEDWCYLLGRWVGDGCFHHDEGITISFHSDDEAGFTKVRTIIERLFGKIYDGKQLKHNCRVITVCNSLVFFLFKQIFTDYKRYSDSKHFPHCFRNLPDNLLRSMLLGYREADGCNREYGESTKTISKTLALQTKEALLYLKIVSGTSIEYNPCRYGKPTKANYCTGFFGLKTNRKIPAKEINNKGYFSLVRNIEKAEPEETFDIKVKDDSSYVSCNFAAHNSVGGCLTAYLNNIHQVYPKKYGLIFERFLNKDKYSVDIDSDIAPSGLSAIQGYLRTKYGETSVASISNFNTIAPKVYAKDIARIFEFGGEGRTKAVEIGNAIADSIPKEIHTIKQALEEAPLFAEYAKQYPELGEYAELLCGKPRALSMHASGFVVCRNDLEGLVPLRRDPSGALVLQYEKKNTEENNIVKIDLLGLETLDIIKETYKLINENGKPINDNFDCEMNDLDTYKLISDGDTFGVFQLKGTAVHVCKKVKPKTISDIALVSALIRPSSKDIIDDLLKVRNGEKKMALLHPNLHRAFSGTYGFGLYEESLLHLYADFCENNLLMADRLRQLTKEKGKNPQKTAETKEMFIVKGMQTSNVSRELAEQCWNELVEPFNGYGFTRVHSTMYSLTSFHTAYLKAHYPVEFLTANLMSQVNSNAQSASENIAQIKSELRAHGVNIVPPSINTSELSWKIVNDKTLMAGLNSLKYVSSNDAIPEILANRPFSSFKDLIYRTNASKLRAQAIQSMAASGSLDEFKIDRKLMFLYVSDYRAKLKAHMNKLEKLWAKEYAKDNNLTKKKDGTFVDANKNAQAIPPVSDSRVKEHLDSFEYPFPEETPWTTQEAYAFEEFYMGEGLSGDSFSRYQGFFDRKKTVPFEAVKEMFPYELKNEDERLNRKANTYYLGNYKMRPLEAIITNMFVFTVKKEDSPIFGQEMARITIQDPWGDEAGLLCFPESWSVMKNRIEKELSGGKQKVEPGVAIRFLGSFQWENDHTTSFVLSDILDYKSPPRLPDERASKKVKMPRGKKALQAEEIVDMNKEEIFEELEDEILDDGMETIEDN